MASNVERLSVGTSGWSYPSWRPGFYPAGTANEDFLAFYAARLPSVELNSTGYRLPSEEQFARWAAAVPDGFTFAVKAPPRALRDVATFEERVRRSATGSGRCGSWSSRRATTACSMLLLGSTELRVALDLRHESWDGVDVAPAVRVNDWEADAPFRYLRFREPPYADEELAAIAGGSGRCSRRAWTSSPTSATRTRRRARVRRAAARARPRGRRLIAPPADACRNRGVVA